MAVAASIRAIVAVWRGVAAAASSLQLTAVAADAGGGPGGEPSGHLLLLYTW